MWVITKHAPGQGKSPLLKLLKKHFSRLVVCCHVTCYIIRRLSFQTMNLSSSALNTFFLNLDRLQILWAVGLKVEVLLSKWILHCSSNWWSILLCQSLGTSYFHPLKCWKFSMSLITLAFKHIPWNISMEKLCAEYSTFLLWIIIMMMMCQKERLLCAATTALHDRLYLAEVMVLQSWA